MTKEERRDKIMFNLWKRSELSNQEKENITDNFYSLGLVELTNSAFATGRINEYQYYQLHLEKNRNNLLRLLIRACDTRGSVDERELGGE